MCSFDYLFICKYVSQLNVLLVEQDFTKEGQPTWTNLFKARFRFLHNILKKKSVDFAMHTLSILCTGVPEKR